MFLFSGNAEKEIENDVQGRDREHQIEKRRKSTLFKIFDAPLLLHLTFINKLFNYIYL